MTWGRKNGDQQNCQFFPPLCTYEGMDSLLHERYVMMAQDNQACVAPVGHVWHYLRDHNSDIELYQSDESHPSLAGSYAAACTFYASIFRKSPMSIATDENLPQDMALAIRQAATHLVFDSLDAWCYLSPSDTTPDDTVSIADYNKQHFILYPNPVTNTLTLQFEHRSYSTTEVEILDAAGRIVKQFRFLAEEEITMPVSDLKDGIYFLNVRQGRTPYTVQKFIKKSE